MCTGSLPSSSLSEECALGSHQNRRVSKEYRHRILRAFRSNQEYLLQRCLHYDWKTVALVCLVLRDYSDRKRHTKVSAAQLNAMDAWGNTPLHAACYFQPPPMVVKLLLDAAKLYNVSMITATNSKGATPLIIACSSGATLEVIQELLESGDSSTVATVDTELNTPFAALVRRYQMLRCIPKISKTSLALEQVTKDEVVVDEPSPRSNNSASNNVFASLDALEGDFHNAKLFHSFWIKTEAMIRAGWSSRAGHYCRKERSTSPLRKSFHSMLHGAAHISGLLPPVLTDLIVRCHRDAVADEVSHHGILPLHLAVTLEDNENVEHEQQSHNKRSLLQEQRTYFIGRILSMDPETANRPIPGTGRLPLNQAIASGLLWHLKKDDDNNTSSKGPLQLLWNAAPDAISQYDPVTGLKPFMLAATIKSSNQCEQQQQQQLDTIYSLLKLDPSAVNV